MDGLINLTPSADQPVYGSQDWKADGESSGEPPYGIILPGFLSLSLIVLVSVER